MFTDLGWVWQKTNTNPKKKKWRKRFEQPINKPRTKLNRKLLIFPQPPHHDITINELNETPPSTKRSSHRQWLSNKSKVQTQKSKTYTIPSFTTRSHLGPIIWHGKIENIHLSEDSRKKKKCKKIKQPTNKIELMSTSVVKEG